jgi:hypothetical protein
MSDRDAAMARFRTLINSPPPVDPVEGTRAFLRAHLSDALTVHEALEHVARLASSHPRTVVRDLAAMEALLAAPPDDYTISALVARDANRGLDDPSEEAARAWLADLAARVREVLGDKAPPPPS